MDEFHINFNILGKYGDFNSWQKAELSFTSQEKNKKQRKREESSEEGEAKRFGKLYFSAEKHYER